MPESEEIPETKEELPGFYAILFLWDEKKDCYRVDVGDLGPYEVIGLLEHALAEVREQLPPLSWVGWPDADESEEEGRNG